MRTMLYLLTLAAPFALAQTATTSADAAAGAQPGDASLTCEQIHAELTKIASDPAFQRLMASQQASAAGARSQLAQHPESARQIDPNALADLSGAAATGDPSAVQKAALNASQDKDSTNTAASGDQAPAPPKKKRRGLFKGIGAAIGTGAAGAFGANRGAVAAQQAQIDAMGKAGHAAQDAERPVLDAQAAQAAQLSPQLTRGMHLTQLAEARGCARQ